MMISTNPGPSMHEMILWESDAPEYQPDGVRVIAIDHFNARGMRRVYGRFDQLGGGFNLNIWRSRRGKPLMRCWSRYSDYQPASFEVTGINPPDVRRRDGMPQLTEDWVPKVVRDAYEEWGWQEF